MAVLDGYLISDLATVVQESEGADTEGAGQTESGGERNKPLIVHAGHPAPWEPDTDTVLRRAGVPAYTHDPFLVSDRSAEPPIVGRGIAVRAAQPLDQHCEPLVSAWIAFKGCSRHEADIAQEHGPRWVFLAA
ncbi:hypothetical protein [Streptomyces mirabilis]